MSRRNVIKRHQYADYLNISTEESTPNWVLMGTGFTTLDEQPGAQSESVKYVNEKTSSSEVVSYETVFPFEADQIMDEDAIKEIYTIGRNHLIGADAQREYCRVELWDKATGTNTFKARKFTVSVEVSETSGENKMNMSGNLNAVGDPVDGTFNTSTKTFTEASDSTSSSTTTG